MPQVKRHRLQWTRRMPQLQVMKAFKCVRSVPGRVGEQFELADALLEINKDSMSDNGKNLYDSISGDIFPAACKRKTANAENSLDSGAYDDAIAELTKVLTMDSSYNDGKAIYLIAQAYQGKQDTENAKKYYRCIWTAIQSTVMPMMLRSN